MTAPIIGHHALGLLVALLPSLAAAQPLPGLGATDPRIAVDPSQAPWNAVVRVQVPGVSVCTGFMVAPRVALTAAHCLYGNRLGHFVPAGSIHLLSRYESGGFAHHTLVQSYRIAPGYDPRAPDATRGSDAAVLVLTEDVAAGQRLPIATVVPLTETILALAGYSQDRAQRLQIDPGCRALGLVVDQVGALMLRHSCAGTKGTSGGPILQRDENGDWRVVGLQSGANPNERGGVAVTGATLRLLLN